MNCVRYAFLTVLLTATSVLSAPPDVPTTLDAKPAQLVRIVVKAPAEFGYLKNFTDTDAFFGELVSPVKGERHFVFQPPVDGTKSQYVLGWFTKGETEGVATTITVIPIVPPTPPTPPTPPVDPTVPTPPPTPAKSFHVFLIYESGATLTAAQRGVIYGVEVETWLNANTTGGKVSGWRRRDKDAAGDADKVLAPIWTAIQPNITVTPCVAIERDNKIDLVNVEATPTKMIEVLTKYKTGVSK